MALLVSPSLGGCLDLSDELPAAPASSRTSPQVSPTPQGSAAATPATTPPSPSASASTPGSSASTSGEDSNIDPCSESEEGQTAEETTEDLEGYREAHFEWEYADTVWTWDPLIPTEWWYYYSTRERPRGAQNYGVFATDPYDDPIMDQVVCIIRDAAREAGYSEYETVEFTLSFVQSLEYITDKAGKGYDDYPKYPIETLIDQRGDCEDTSILLATLLKALGYDAVLLFFPRTNDKPDIGHVATGIYSKNIPGGTYWENNGRRYYYVETTGERWDIGQVPPNIKGQKASVIPLVPRAILHDLRYDSPTFENGLYKFELTLRNIGSEAVEDLTIRGGWDAGNNRAWSAQTWNESYRLEPDDEVTVTFHLEPPPRNVWTRSTFSAWGSNAVRVSGHSEYFRT